MQVILVPSSIWKKFLMSLVNWLFQVWPMSDPYSWVLCAKIFANYYIQARKVLVVTPPHSKEWLWTSARMGTVQVVWFGCGSFAQNLELSPLSHCKFVEVLFIKSLNFVTGCNDVPKVGNWWRNCKSKWYIRKTGKQRSSFWS